MGSHISINSYPTANSVGKCEYSDEVTGQVYDLTFTICPLTKVFKLVFGEQCMDVTAVFDDETVVELKMDLGNNQVGTFVTENRQAMYAADSFIVIPKMMEACF